MDTLNKIILWINDNILWGIPMVVAILGTGIFLSIRSRFLQVRKFHHAHKETLYPTIKSIAKPKAERKKGEKTISQFEAFATAISGTVGTGNIVGVAGAMLSGGPGAVFWMWFSAFFGMFTNYSENVLGLYYRKKDKNGTVSGGPMYYIKEGAKLPWLGFIFAICCMLAAIGMGMVQSNSISGILQSTITTDSSKQKLIAYIVGAIVTAIVILIVLGGIKRIGRFASLIVPFMALLFIICAFIIIFMNITIFPSAIVLIFKNAFSLRAFGGGLFGYTIMKAMRYGCARGVFSNEAGLGSSVIAHSASDTKEPVKQGLWGIIEIFLDTFVICTLTAVTLLCVAKKGGSIDFTNISANANIDKNSIANLAFTTSFGTVGKIIFAIVLPLFAFTTIIAWSYYGEKAAGFLFEKNEKLGILIFKIIFIILIFVGSIVKSDLVWNLDDMFNALMALPNLIGLIICSGTIVKITKNYFDRKKGIKVEPMLSAYPERNKELIEELEKEQSERKEEPTL